MHSDSGEANYMEINMEINPYQTFYLNRDRENGKYAHMPLFSVPLMNGRIIIQTIIIISLTFS